MDFNLVIAVRASAKGAMTWLSSGNEALVSRTSATSEPHSSSLLMCLCEVLSSLDLDVNEVKKTITKK